MLFLNRGTVHWLVRRIYEAEVARDSVSRNRRMRRSHCRRCSISELYQSEFLASVRLAEYAKHLMTCMKPSRASQSHRGAPQETSRLGVAALHHTAPGRRSEWTIAGCKSSNPGVIRSRFIMAYQFRGKHHGALSAREKIGRASKRDLSSSSAPFRLSLPRNSRAWAFVFLSR